MEEIDAGAEFAREFDRFAPLKAVFWLKASDEELRYLYLASDRIDEVGRRAAYLEVVRLTNLFRSPYLDPFRVKVIGGKDPLTQAAVETNRDFPDLMPRRFGGTTFGGTFVDDGYLYPSPLPETAS